MVDATYINALRNGYSWDHRKITYWFNDTWTPKEKAAVVEAFNEWSKVSPLNFELAASKSSADINFAFADLKATDGGNVLGRATRKEVDGKTLEKVLVQFDKVDHPGWSNELAKGGYSFVTILHEIGHALGLAHPWQAATKFYGVDDQKDAGTYGDSSQLFTLMSYRNVTSYYFPDKAQGSGFSAGPMAFDIAAIQAIYGTSVPTVNSGDTTYVLGRNPYFETITDHGGKDTIRYDGTLDARIDLRAASLSIGADNTNPDHRFAGGNPSYAIDAEFHVAYRVGGFTIAHGTRIENAIGSSGSDNLTGNKYANELVGKGGTDFLDSMGGADTLRGGEGSDYLRAHGGAETLIGGSGNDYYTIVGTNETVVETTSGDAFGDTINFSTISFDTIRYVENYTYGGTGRGVVHVKTKDVGIVGFTDYGKESQGGVVHLDIAVQGTMVSNTAGKKDVVYVHRKDTFFTAFEFEDGRDVINLSALGIDQKMTSDQYFDMFKFRKGVVPNATLDVLAIGEHGASAYHLEAVDRSYVNGDGTITHGWQYRQTDNLGNFAAYNGFDDYII